MYTRPAASTAETAYLVIPAWTDTYDMGAEETLWFVELLRDGPAYDSVPSGDAGCAPGHYDYPARADSDTGAMYVGRWA